MFPPHGGDASLALVSDRNGDEAGVQEEIDRPENRQRANHLANPSGLIGQRARLRDGEKEVRSQPHGQRGGGRVEHDAGPHPRFVRVDVPK